LTAAGAGHGGGEEGHIVADGPGRVTLRSMIGSRRILDLPAGEQLPRIC